MRSGRTLTAALVLVLVLAALLASVSVAGAADPPDGLLDGTPHVLRLRPELGELAAAPRKMSRKQAAAAAAAVATCDPAQVDAARKVPTTKRADDAAPACVVLDRDGERARSFLGAARIAGDGVRIVQRRKVGRDRYQLLVRTTPRGAAQLAATPPLLAGLPQAVDLDGKVIGEATIETNADGTSTALVVKPLDGKGFAGPEAESLITRIRQSRDEQLVSLTRSAALTRHARELVADNETRIDDKDDFARDCPNSEASVTLTLACYTGNRIYVLRVDQPNLAGVMNVSLAHEMLHAAFDELEPKERRRVVKQLEAFMTDTGDPRIEELLVEYERTEPGNRATELHSLVGTQVADLPRPLERHYARYFADRSEVVDAFVGYQTIFDDLQARYDELKAQADALEARLGEVDAAYGAAGAEADRLYDQITSLRNQGRIDESNALVGAQNAAADRANALMDEYNGLVAQYNALIDELNALAAALNENYNAISPEPIPLPTE